MSLVRSQADALLMKKRILIYSIFAILIIVSLGVIFRTQLYQLKATLFPVEEVHLHAGFQVYENGNLKSFSDLAYMHDKPCGDPATQGPVDEQIEKTHMHELVGDVAHVHRKGATWGDFFTNIKYPVEDKQFEAYINEKKVDNLLKMEINKYDRLVLFIGNHDADLKKYFAKQVPMDHIKEVEDRSEQCGLTPEG